MVEGRSTDREVSDEARVDTRLVRVGYAAALSPVTYLLFFFISGFFLSPLLWFVIFIPRMWFYLFPIVLVASMCVFPTTRLCLQRDIIRSQDIVNLICGIFGSVVFFVFFFWIETGSSASFGNLNGGAFLLGMMGVAAFVSAAVTSALYDRLLSKRGL